MLEETLRRLKHYFVQILREDVPAFGKGVKAFHYLVRLFTHMVIELNEAHFLQRAAALAYTTILSLVPVIALFVLYFKMAGKLDTLSQTAQTWILKMFVAGPAHGVAGYLDQFVDGLHTRALGTIGIAGLIFTAYSLLRTVEKSLNALWKVRKHRTIWVRFQILCSILVLVPTALAASLYFSGKVQEYRIFNDYQALTTLMQTAFVAIPLALSTFSLFMLYKMMPNTRVRWKPALISALIAAFLFELAKWGFNLYVVKVIPMSKIYGSLGLIPILLLWIYLCWIIVLFGVELGYTIQNLGTLHEEMRERHADNPLRLAVHEEWGLRIVEALARRFRRGEGPQSAETLAKDVELPVDVVEDHVTVLLEAGLLVASMHKEQSFYLFGQPLEKLTVSDIASVFRRQLSLPPRIDLKEERTLLQVIT